MKTNLNIPYNSKDYVLKVRDAMIEVANDLTIESIDETIKDLNRLQTILSFVNLNQKMLKEQENLPDELETVEKIKPIETNALPEVSFRLSEIITNESNSKQKYYVIETINGYFATIPENDEKLQGAIKIPESVARQIELEDGDVAYLDEMINPKGFPYYVQIIDSIPPTTDIVRIEKAIVKKKEADYYVEESIATTVKLSEPLIIPLNIILAKHIIEGDIVDIRYSLDNPSDVRVIWKYEHSAYRYYKDQEVVTFSFNKKNEPDKKENKQKEEKKKESSLKPELVVDGIEGLTVLMIGMCVISGEVRSILSAQGANFVSFDRKNASIRTLEGVIRKADIVVYGLNLVSHAQTISSTKICKKYNIPFKGFNGFSKRQVIETLKELVPRYHERQGA